MKPILPGSTLGVIGGGQLGRMLALEAQRMGYRVAVLSPRATDPAAQVADSVVLGALDDPKAAQALAEQSDVVTIETEHVPARILESLTPLAPVRPSATVLHIVQDRLEQRRFLASRGAPQTQHMAVADLEGLAAAARRIGLPAVLKTRRAGYDGKGQVRIAHESELARAWGELGSESAILEAMVDFEREISVVLARGLEGEVSLYPMPENEHRQHVLRTSRIPASLRAEIRVEAERIAVDLASALSHVGVMAIEFFVTKKGNLLVNEVAPRTHNSGHFTLGACATSQFEQHIRAICGLPLGDVTLLRPAVMLNLLGELWREGEPNFEPVFARPEARLHLYGKTHAKRGRKMGHLLVMDESLEHAVAITQSLETSLEAATGTARSPWRS